MDLNSIPLISLLAKRMSWLNKRQTVLAQNIANANTPGYVARDLKPLDFRALARAARDGVDLTTTHPVHFASQSSDVVGRTLVRERGVEATPSGNAVVVEEEMMKIGRSRSDYALMVNLYRKHVGMIRSALSRGLR